MKLPMYRACAALLCLVLASCVPPGSGGTGGGGGGAAVLTINNRPITADQLISSPFIRESLRNLVFYESMVDAAKKAGVTIDEKEVDKTFDEQKQQFAAGDAKGWQEFLAQNMATEDEFKNQIRSQMYFQGLVKKRVEVTEDEMKDSWAKEKDDIIAVYAQQNHIPEADKAKVTYEQAKDTIKSRLEAMKGMQAQEQVMQEVVSQATFVINAMSDKEKAKLIEDLVLNNEKKRLADSAAEREKAGAPNSSTPPMGGGAPEGGAAVPPAEGSMPPAEGGK